jgi:hypothetical protein
MVVGGSVSQDDQGKGPSQDQLITDMANKHPELVSEFLSGDPSNVSARIDALTASMK